VGALSFFGVHGTSVHRDNQLLHPDNKGCAAAAMERRMATAHGAPDFVAGFAQAPAGDVTPNFRRDRARGLVIGELDDDFESARANGDHQFRQAYRLLDGVGPDDALAPTLDAALIYADLAEVELAPRFSEGQAGACTSPAEIGLRMIMGTEEGPGLPYILTRPVERAARLWRGWQRVGQRLGATRLPGARRAASQAGKLGLLDTGMGPRARIVGLLPMARSLPLPDAVHPIVAYAKRVVRRGGLDQHPLTPRVLPLQIAILDRLAIVAVPGETTTVAGRRLRQGLLERLAPRGVTRVVVCPYSNSYAGYITTPEEYDRQAYEGASTHFGRWTLGAYQTLFDGLGRRLLTPSSRRSTDLGLAPPRFSPEVLAARAFEPRAP
jgi:neutral ceramidase